MHLAPAALCCIGASGEPKWAYNEVIGWSITVGVIEGKKTALLGPEERIKKKLVTLHKPPYAANKK